MCAVFDGLDQKPPYIELLFSKLQDAASIQTQRDYYQKQPVEISKNSINGLVKSVFGPPPYHGQTRNILEAFNELLLLLRREELVRAPQIVTHVPLGMPYTTGMQEGDEYLPDSLAAIHNQFLAEPPSRTDPDFHDAGFSKEDFLAAQVVFALVASGDVLIQYPAHAVAHFRVDALQPGNPATMLCLHNKQMRRWPISPLSLICLLRLLGLMPRAGRENAYFFSERFF